MKTKRMLLFVLGFCLLGVVLVVSQFQMPVSAGILLPTGNATGERSGGPTALPTAAPQACRLGEGWRWMSGEFLPDVASQAQLALQEEGFAASATARSFGEVDSCGAYNPFAIDFAVELSRLSPDVGMDRDRTVQAIRQILAAVAHPSLGVLQVAFLDGEQVVLRPDAALESLVAPVPGLDSHAEALTKKVYVVVYDPLLSNGQHLSDYLHWNEHATLTQGTVDFFAQASHGEVGYQVVQTTVLTDGWPEKIDGFRYTEQQYLAAISGQGSWHSPDAVNYNKIVNDSRLDICGKANRGEIDEVWIYNGPGFGFFESTLVGPDAYFFNSSPVPEPYDCSRLIPIMGPSPERGLDCAIENFGHRTESIMTRVYGIWDSTNPVHNNWEKFALVDWLAPAFSYSGCGNVHYPPNGTSDYDYSNPSTAKTNCDDFTNYPDLSQPSTVWHPVTCTTWSCDHLSYFGYWFGHLPHNMGCGSDGVAADWWGYFANPALANKPSASCMEARVYLPIVLANALTTPTFCDRFDGSGLDRRWSLVDPLGGATTRIPQGSGLVFSAPSGGRDLYNGVNTNAPRLLQIAPGGAWSVTSHVRAGAMGGGFQTAGLLYWVDADHYVWFGIGTGSAVQGILQSDAGRVGVPWLVSPSLHQTDLFVRLERTAAGYVRAGYSESGVAWFDSADMEFPYGVERIGPVLINAWAAPAFTATFDYFLWNWCD